MTVVFVKKTDGTHRLCIDYRKLSAKTISDRYPLPVNPEPLDNLQGARYFSTLGLLAGYQIAIHPQDVYKTALLLKVLCTNLRDFLLV